MGFNSELIEFTGTVPPELAQSRLDLVVCSLFPEYSRACVQNWIKAGYVTVDGKVLKPKAKVKVNQLVVVTAQITPVTTLVAQNIALNLVYEDQDLIVVNKPPGLVTHPGAGNPQHTLLNALIYHYPELMKLPRGGIVHRLDKDTSGLMLISRKLQSYHKLVTALQERKIKREYEAIVNGRVIAGSTVEAPIGRHRSKRTQMAVRAEGKLAITHYRIIRQFNFFTHLQVILATGRTHQIRVHLAHIGYPIVGDPMYGRANKAAAKIKPDLRQHLTAFKRQALHARFLSLSHPKTGKLLEFKAAPPTDFKELLKILVHYDTI